MLSGFGAGSLTIGTIWRRRDAMEWHDTLSVGPSLNRGAAACGAAGTSPHGASFFYFTLPTRMEPGNDT